jgi:hypothetical protein
MYKTAAMRTGGATHKLGAIFFSVVAHPENANTASFNELQRLSQRFSRISLRHFSFQSTPRYRDSGNAWSIANVS